jgi:hypothetical protein
MGRTASGLFVAVLVLVAVFAASVASASKSVTPKLGLYFGQTSSSPKDGNVEAHETEVKVVKTGKRQGAQVRVSPFLPTSCSGNPMPGGFSVSEKSPISIHNGMFHLDRTTHPRIAGGAGTSTMRTVVVGTFKSATKVVVEVSVNFSYSVQYPGQPEVKGTCTGKQTGIAVHK